MKQVTQQQVAEKANVSRATVSYVLNGKGSESVPISEETRTRVLEAIRVLGYRPNLQARNLKSGRSFTIGVMVIDIHNPHFWQYLGGIEAEAHRHGYAILVFHTALQRNEENVVLHELTQKRIDGAIINLSFGLSQADGLETLGQSGLPIVDLAGQESPFDHISCDYTSATEELMAHLYSLGHRRYGFVYGVANASNGLDRLQPYTSFARAHGLGDDFARVEECLPSQEDAYQATLRLLDAPVRPTAILAINDYLALGVLRAAADRGLRVPQDLSVAGFDDIPFAQFSVPRLTTVSRDTEEGGRRAFHLLLKRMNGDSGPLRVEKIASVLKVRESTGPAPLPVAQGGRPT